MVSKDEARKELARRELARRRAQTQKTARPDNRSGFLGKVDATVRGAADTISLGFADEIAAGLGTGFGMLGDYDAELARQRGIDQSDSEDRFGYRLGGQIGGGLLGGAGMVRAGLSPSAAAVNAGMRLPAVAGASAVEGALLGGLHGLGSGTDAESRIDQAKSGAIWGGGIGLAAPLAIAGVQRAISPFRTGAERTAAAELLRQEGVPVSAGQLTGNRRLRFAESEIGGGRAADLMAQQQDAFTAAALRRAGIEGTRATPEVIDNAFQAIGKQFDDLARQNTLKPDAQMVSDLRAAFNSYGLNTAESMRAPIIEKVTNDIVGAMKRGNISGEAYQSLASDLARSARGASNPDTRNALYALREVLDDAMERSMQAAGSSDVGAFQAARGVYRNLLGIADAATRAGEQAAEGIITPAALRNLAVGQGRQSYARGRGDFAELARAGNMLLAPLPDSGTAGRLSARNLLPNSSTVGAILGGGPGTAMGNPMMAVAGALAGAAAPRAAGAALMSRPVQAYLANQVGTQITPEMRAVINALINAEGSAAAGRLAP